MAVGDTHCNVQFALRVCRYAKDNDIKVIIPVGDFGFKFPKEFIHVWRQWLENDDERRIYWLDGNHDDHDYLRDVVMKGQSYDEPVAHWHPNFMYCPRGSVATIGETKCQFVGGAYSIDRWQRKLGKTWWEDECTSEEDMHRAVRNGTPADIDIMFTHDCPGTEWFDQKLLDGDYKVDKSSAENREKITKIVKAVAPVTVVHGHYHQYYWTSIETRKGSTRVIGLAADFDQGWTASVVPYGNVYLMDL